jgi:hypothetical protein
VTVPFEASMLAHAIIESDLAAMAKGWMPKVMAKASSLDKAKRGEKRMSRVRLTLAFQLPCDASCDLRDLQRVRETCPVEVAITQVQDLRLPLQPPERAGMHDSRIVHVEGATRILRLLLPAALALAPFIAHTADPC